MTLLPKTLLIAGLIQVACQVFKLVYYSARQKRWDWHYLATPGGMPSAHSAFAGSITTAVGLSAGFNTDLFAVSFVFAAIVIYDAFRLRGLVQRQAILLNEVQDHLWPDQARPALPTMVGHTLPEIAVGLILGIGLAAPLTLFWPL